MKACILAIGSEMLTPFRVDTNSLVITDRLNAIGYDVRLKAVVADDVSELARVIESALAWADLLVITGGLGPTEDDITRDAVARVLGIPLDVDEAIVDRIRERFARRGMTMPEINRRQAMVPRGADVLPNPNGTAPGLWLERGRTAIVLLPGPPREMTPMLDAVIRERLAPKAAARAVPARAEDHGARGVRRRRAGAAGLRQVDDAGRADQHDDPGGARPDRAAPDGAGGEPRRRTPRSTRRCRNCRTVLGPAIYSTDGRSLEAVVGDLLRERKLTIAVAESCTGGLLASRLTDVPGSSDYVERGVVCYSNRAKTELAGVPETLIRGARRGQRAGGAAMAEGIRARAGTNVGIGVTGIAGPGGGTPEKPVGTVAVAVVVDDEARADVPVLRRPRDGEVSGGAGGAQHDASGRDACAGPARMGRAPMTGRLRAPALNRCGCSSRSIFTDRGGARRDPAAR